MSEPLDGPLHRHSQGVLMSLEKFEEAIQADQDVIGMLYTGSLGRGTAEDRKSVV